MSPAKQALKACEIITTPPSDVVIREAVNSINRHKTEDEFILEYLDAVALVQALWPKRINHVVFTYEQNEAS